MKGLRFLITYFYDPPRPLPHNQHRHQHRVFDRIFCNTDGYLEIMTKKETIKKFIEGDYKFALTLLNPSFERLSEEEAENWGGGREAMLKNCSGIGLVAVLEKRWLELLFHPKFWKCLGKAMGWGHKYRKTTVYDKEFLHDKRMCKKCHHKEYICLEPLDYWHSLIDHLAKGGTINSYFETL